MTIASITARRCARSFGSVPIWKTCDVPSPTTGSNSPLLGIGRRIELLENGESSNSARAGAARGKRADNGTGTGPEHPSPRNLKIAGRFLVVL